MLCRTISRADRRSSGDGQDGFALITTVLVIALLTAFSLVALQQTLASTESSRKDQDWVAALGAAQAGLDDYLRRLNASNGSYASHNVANPDTSAGMGTAGGLPVWAPVPTAGGEAARASYHLDVHTDRFFGTSSVVPNGNIEVTSTGKVGTRTRTLKASVRRSGFLDFVYFTDLETLDPLTYSTAKAVDDAAACAVPYLPEGARPAPPTCLDVAFTGDTLDGPVHSNDTMLICDGNRFLDVVTTASAAVGSKHYRTNQKNFDGTAAVPTCGAAGTTTFARPGDPVQVERVSMPSTNTTLKRETSLPAPAVSGCLYVGPTKIVVDKNQLHVTSPWTKVMSSTACKKDAWFSLPVNGVVYVDVVPASGPNKPAAGEVCPSSGDNRLGYPLTSTSSPTGVAESGWRYPCKAGDVFIEQLGGLPANGLNGRLTVVASNDIYVTNHLEYATGTTGSFLGLIAEQFLYVWHPVNPSAAQQNLKPLTNLKISAAMLSVNHTIMLQNHRYGDPMGTLTVTGGLISKFRGGVGTTNTSGAPASGYVKNYVYDRRLRYDGPPKFLNPLVSSFVAARTADAGALYR